MPEDDDIQVVRSEEERRGKRPVDIAAKRRALLIRKKFYEVLRSGNEQQFEEMLTHDLGQIPGSAAYIQSWKAWKSYHGHE
jgi:hypothetical protein